MVRFSNKGPIEFAVYMGVIKFPNLNMVNLKQVGTVQLGLGPANVAFFS